MQYVEQYGWKVVLLVYGIIAVMVALILLSLYLIFGDDQCKTNKVTPALSDEEINEMNQDEYENNNGFKLI